MDPWLHGTASDPRSKGCVFDSHRVHSPPPRNRSLFFCSKTPSTILISCSLAHHTIPLRPQTLRSSIPSLSLYRNGTIRPPPPPISPPPPLHQLLHLPTLLQIQNTHRSLFLLKSETNPEKILEICRSASLTPHAHIDRITFSVAIDKLAKSNNFSYIDDFLTDLRTSRPDLRTVRFAAHSIILYGQAGMLDHAIRLFKEYHEKNQNDAVLTSGSVKLLNALLFSCILAKKHDEVKRVFVDFSKRYKIKPNLETFNTVIQSFCESGNSSSSYSVLNEMDMKGVKPNETTFGHLFAGFYSEEKYEDVGTVSKMIEDYGINAGIGVYNIRIHSLCKLKRAKEAKVLLEGCLAKGIKPNGVTYSHLILGFCMEGDLEEAKRLFKSMENRGCQPAYSCYATLVYFLGKVGDFESAYWVCKESMGKKMVPNISTMKILVQGLASSGVLDKAKELIGEVKERFSKNIELWNEVEAGLPQ